MATPKQTQNVGVVRNLMTQQGVTSQQPVTVVAIDMATGKNVFRQFSTYQLAENWIASDYGSANLEILRLA